MRHGDSRQNFLAELPENSSHAGPAGTADIFPFYLRLACDRNCMAIVGGFLMVAVVPFTLLAIMPTNKALMALALDKTPVDAEPLLRRWGRLHAIRTLLSLLSLLVFLFVLVLHPHHS